MNRRRARELALQILFHIDVGRSDPERALAEGIAREEAEQQLPPGWETFTSELVRGAVAHQAVIDATLAALAREWSMDRMAAVDRNILRLGAYELLYRSDIPPGAVINEAVELAKLYSTAESGRFVNGVLGNLARRQAAVNEDEPSAVSRD